MVAMLLFWLMHWTFRFLCALLSYCTQTEFAFQKFPETIQIEKYFRNTHLQNAWYKENGGKELDKDVR